MASMTDYLSGKQGDAALRGIAYTPPANHYLALFTSATNDAMTAGAEVSGGGYVRQLITFSARDATKLFKQAADVPFPIPSANWGTLQDWAIFDAATGGNPLHHGPLREPVTITTGKQFILPAGTVAILYT